MKNGEEERRKNTESEVKVIEDRTVVKVTNRSVMEGILAQLSDDTFDYPFCSDNSLRD